MFCDHENVCLCLCVEKTCIHEFYPETPLNTDTPLIRTIWPVPLVSILTGFHCIILSLLLLSRNSVSTMVFDGVFVFDRSLFSFRTGLRFRMGLRSSFSGSSFSILPSYPTLFNNGTLPYPSVLLIWDQQAMKLTDGFYISADSTFRPMNFCKFFNLDKMHFSYEFLKILKYRYYFLAVNPCQEKW